MAAAFEPFFPSESCGSLDDGWEEGGTVYTCILWVQLGSEMIEKIKIKLNINWILTLTVFVRNHIGFFFGGDRFSDLLIAILIYCVDLNSGYIALD